MVIHQRACLRPRALEALEIGRDAALFLDFDGTLVDLAATPDAIGVPQGLVPLLIGLEAALGGALALVTGRPIADIDRFLAPARLVVAGVHGAEYRTSALDEVRPTALPLDEQLVDAVRRLEKLFPGVLVEPKGQTVAVHWRQVPEAAADLAEALRMILDGGPDHLEISRGRRVFEICPRHVSKGAAVDILAGLEVFRGRRPIVVGDDISDESGIAAAERLGGIGLRVLGETFTEEEADFASPRQVREWLSVLLERSLR